MGKNDFDRDYDFEKELGFDLDAFLSADEYDENGETPAFTDEELGLTTQDADAPAQEEAEDAYDLDEDLDDFLNMGSQDEEDFPADDDQEELFQEEELPEQTDWEEAEEPADEAESEETQMDEQEQTQQEAAELGEEEERSPRRKREKRKRVPKKPAMPGIFTKFYDLYFAPVLDKSMLEEPRDPNNPRRRRRKSKVQIFKEVYLPPIVACLCLILVLSFVIGAVSNFIRQRRIDAGVQQSQLDASVSAEQEAAANMERVRAEAELLAAQYDYEGAITLLDSLGDLTGYPELSTLRSSYASAQTQLTAFQDYTQIPNLSFHPLIVDMSRALKEPVAGQDDLRRNYNMNFVTADEFTKILNQLYENGYVLVDLDSFLVNNSDVIITDAIYLPAGKKPVMITETLTNYFDYMIDSNGDDVPDSNGSGFASKLVVDSSGDIKAEYVDASGTTLTGDYDLVPILESFIEEHPDFSYRGARAIVAVTGMEGVFGYRVNSSYTATKGQTYTDEQVAGAKEVAQALRDKGYTIACNSFNNENYGNLNANQIQADLQSWTSQIVPVLGTVDVFVFARSSNITEYGSGNAFNFMYSAGFRYFISNGSQPWAQATSSYFRQNRLMVTGSNMAYNSSWFTGMFDCAAILDVNARGTVPQG